MNDMETIDLSLLNSDICSPRTVAIIIITVTGRLKCWFFVAVVFYPFYSAIVCPTLAGTFAVCVCVFVFVWVWMSVLVEFSSIVLAIVLLYCCCGLMVVVVAICWSIYESVYGNYVLFLLYVHCDTSQHIHDHDRT